MRILVDTNVLLRLAQPDDVRHAEASRAVQRQEEAGNELVVNSRVLTELWVVETRPKEANGYGFTVSLAQRDIQNFRTTLEYLDDSVDTFSEWERIVFGYRVLGKSAHDAKLVAWMIASGVPALMTFNSADFKRFTEIQVIEP